MKTQGTKLSTYARNMFATCDSMEAALEQVHSLATGGANSAGVFTAAHVLLNTAIKLHQAEMDKVNKPLLELIEAKVQEAFATVDTQIDVALEAYGHKLTQQVTEAIDDLDLDHKIETWIDENLYIDAKVQDWMENSFDVESILSGKSFSITFD